MQTTHVAVIISTARLVNGNLRETSFYLTLISAFNYTNLLHQPNSRDPGSDVTSDIITSFCNQTSSATLSPGPELYCQAHS